MEKMRNCPDCAVKPGEQHQGGCDVERCTQCGYQRIGCDCDLDYHDGAFARWSGFWPGSLEADAMGIDLNTFYNKGYHEILFVDPIIREYIAFNAPRKAEVKKNVAKVGKRKTRKRV